MWILLDVNIIPLCFIQLTWLCWPWIIPVYHFSVILPVYWLWYTQQLSQSLLFQLSSVRSTPSPSILSMALWLLWAQMDASASGTKTPAPSWRPRSSLTSPLRPAASTRMATSLHILLVTTGQRYVTCVSVAQYTDTKEVLQCGCVTAA